MSVLFLNPNRISPPVAPLAVDYLAEALETHAIPCRVLDLCLDAPPGESVSPSFLASHASQDLKAVLITVRNLDDAYYASRVSFLPETRALVRTVKETFQKPVIVGGSGFSVAPEAILAELGADLGVQGAAELDLIRLLQALERSEPPAGLPGVLQRDDTGVPASPPSPPTLEEDVYSARRFVRNRDYFLRGGAAGLETKRGCPEPCRYCVDPASKGRRVFTKPLATLLKEIRSLLDQGVNVFHLCDSEFNVPHEHAVAVCDAIRAEGLADRIRWYTYAAPQGFREDLAHAMAGAGCAGINFGVDHCRAEILEALGRRHTAQDLERAAEAYHRAGIPFLFDLLLGGPGETRETLREAVELCRHLRVPRVGVNVGIRVYPGTELAHQVKEQGPLADNPDLEGCLEGNPDLLYPVFYRSHLLGNGWEGHLESLVHGDPRYFLPRTSDGNANYNYNENLVLVEALNQGHRGAFWDILRRIQDGLPPLQVPENAGEKGPFGGSAGPSSRRA